MLDPESIEITPDGEIEPGMGVRERLTDRAGRYTLLMESPGVLVLRGKTPGRVQMAGEILTRMSVMEIINVIATSGWRGDMHLHGPEFQRKLTFDQGALKAAWSNAPGDRLGETLLRAGKITRAQVNELAADMSEKRFGELAVERGLVDAQELFGFLQRQTEDIFFGALLVASGFYLFIVDGEEPSGTTVHLPVQGLLMEGVQRIDEMALFRDKIPNSGMCPRKNPDAKPPKKLDAGAMRVLELCDGERSIEDISRVSGMSEFATTKAVYHLLQQKQITLHAPINVDPQQVHALVGQFNEVLQDIFFAVATYGGLSQTRETLDAWITGSGYGPFFGEGVDDLGTIDPNHVAHALRGVELEHPIEALQQALHELAAFALFSATTVLPRDQELSLARDVNARLKAIRM